MADRPTPHSTAVCLLIALHSDPLSIIHKSANSSNASNRDQDIQDHLSKLIRHIVLQTPNDDLRIDDQQHIIVTIEEMTFKQLLKSVAGANFQYRDAAKFLFDDLKRATSSIDSLVDLFAAFRWTVAQGVIDGDSSHGIYVRKRCLGFDELGFDAVGRFWESVCDYVDEVDWNQFEAEWEVSGCKKTDTSDSGVTVSTSERSDFGKMSPDTKSHTKWPPAPKQILRTLRLKCDALDKQTDKIPFDEMEYSLQELLSDNPELTFGHFLRFLNFTNNAERVGAIECLHRYFDYAMIHQRKERLLSASRGVSDDTNGTNGQQHGNVNAAQQSNQAQSLGEILNQAAKKSNVVHYVAVVLSALFHRFGNDDMALLSAEESIRVAQQNGDKACFAYALGWLNILAVNDDGSSESDYQIDNGAMLFHRRNSNFVHPSDAWETAVLSISTSTTNMIIDGVVHPSDVATNLQNPIMNNHVPTQEHSINHLAGAGIWNSFGRGNLASVNNELVLRCYDQYLSNNDIGAAAHDLASSVLYGSQETSSSGSLDSESLLDMLEKIKSNQNDLTLGKDTHQTDLYSNVIAQLQDVQKKNPRVTSCSWYHGILKLAHESAARSYDISSSKILETILYSFTPVVTRDSIEAIVESWGQSCISLCQAKKWDEAISLVSKKAIPFCKKNNLQRQECAFLLELARIRMDTSPDDPAVALPVLLDCLALSEERSIDSIHAAALTLLSRFYLELDDISQSRALLQAALPTVLEHCHIFYQGEAWLIASKCSLREYALIQENNDSNLGVDALMHQALSELRYSVDLFQKIGDVLKLRELYYLQAQVYNVIGSIVERDASSKKFLEMNSKISSSIVPTWNSCSLLQSL